MIKLYVFLSSFLFTDWFTMATDHQNPASKQQQPGASAFKVKGKTIIHKSLHASFLNIFFFFKKNSLLSPSWLSMIRKTSRDAAMS